MKKNKIIISKDKVVISVVLGLIFFLLAMLIFVQFKTISQTDITSIETMRTDELEEELTKYKTKTEEVFTELEATNVKILEYEQSLSSEEEASALIQQEVEQYNKLLGKSQVEGEGIVLTLTDTENAKITANDILTLLNDLKQAGAEAISINEQRIIYKSYVVDINYTYISISGERMVSPYVVKAIGNTKYLESAISQKQYGYIDKMLASNKTVTLEKQNKISIPAYMGNLNFEYVEEENK